MPTLSMLSEADKVVSSMTGIRRDILEALSEPDSASGLAVKLGTTRQRVNYHVRALEDAGLIELDFIRQRRGLEERVMRRKADVVLVDPTVFANLSLTAKDTAGVTGVVVTASDLIRQAATVAGAASDEGTNVVTATLDTNVTVKSPSDLRRMVEEIGNVVSRFNSENGLSLRVSTNVLPNPKGKS